RHPGCVVASRPGPLRSRIRQPRRGEPDTSLLRQHRAPPHQPWRRPTTEPRPTHGHRDPHPDGPTHPRLRRETNRRRTNPTGNPPLPEALPRPPDLPPAQRRRDRAQPDLTNIGDSTDSSNSTDGSPAVSETSIITDYACC